MVLQTLVPLEKFVDEFELENVTPDIEYEDIQLEQKYVNRPALQITGFFDHFDSARIQIIGRIEYTYMYNQSPEVRQEVIDKLFSYKIPCMVFCRSLEPFPEMYEAARKYSVPIFKTATGASELYSEATKWLNTEFAEKITMHGVLIDVYGEGLLIIGESGIGKSEAALELIKRGHRLVADDAVEIRKISHKVLTGTCPELIRYLIEVRGIGILDVHELYGAGAVKASQNIDIVVKLVSWDKEDNYDRLGLEDEYIEILGNKIVCKTIPLRPGRNVAVICESAAINHRQKRLTRPEGTIKQRLNL
ncbi:MAG: HPr(Ser) kinase/phosphatase [Clostridiales bacterium]|nr:HPr(Ser) kinase/phosphatase [Clostridiales bacterium]